MPSEQEVIFKMVHDLEKAAPYLKVLKEYIDLTSKVCPTREALKK